jgi:hypothetical protein
VERDHRIRDVGCALKSNSRLLGVRHVWQHLRAAGGGSAIVRSDDGERLRPRQIEHLPGCVADAHFRIEARAAFGATGCVRLIGFGGLPQSLALVIGLPVWLSGRTLRTLLPRADFFSPVLDGGLPLFELFNSRWRSSPAIRAFKVAISAAFAAISARSALVGSGGGSRFIESLNRKLPLPYLPSRCG